MTTHTTTITTDAGGFHRPACPCGWRGHPVRLDVAEAQAQQHMDYVEEVRAMVEGQRMEGGER